MASYQNEKTSLLPIPSGNGDSENSGEYGDDEGDDTFPALNQRRDSFSQMKKTIHNDRVVKKQYNSEEDFGKLLGSTALLKNSLDQNLPDDAALARRHKQQRSNSFTMVLEPTRESSREADFEDISALSFRTNGNSVRDWKHNSFSGLSEREKSHNETNNIIIGEMRKLYRSQISNPSTLYLRKIKTNFFADAKSLAEGTIPQSVVLAIVIGIVCGIACYMYYSVLFFGLEYLWTVLPEEYIIPSDKWSEKYYWLWIPLVNVVMSLCVGLTVVYMGEPGDLPYTISRVHCEAYIPMNHVFPMVFASIFSILGKFGNIFDPKRAIHDANIIIIFDMWALQIERHVEY